MKLFQTICLMVLVGLALPAHASQKGTPIEVKGELIDTWCYYSGVMGSAEAVVGTAHHTCAMWCSAGGIPVGLLAEDGTVYMVLKIDSDPNVAGGDTLLNLASHTITAKGMHYKRDGINYITVSKVVSDDGIPNHTHEDYGPIPPFAIPKPKE